MKRLVTKEYVDLTNQVIEGHAVELGLPPEKLKTALMFHRMRELNIPTPSSLREPRYFIVGATWGEDDKYETFINNSYWQMGYSDDAVPHFTERRNSIHTGDRIAIKKLNGGTSGEMTIRAVGVVRGIVDGTILVDWVCKDLRRVVPHIGCIGTIYGPFRDISNHENRDVLMRIFSL